jgi:hypothetical protein
MAKKQESEKFTGLAGTYSWSNKVVFDPTASPLSTNTLSSPFLGVDEQSLGTSSNDIGAFATLSPKTVALARVVEPGKGSGHMYSIVRPVFSFDFTDPEEYGDAKLHNVRKIQKAKVVLNISSVGTKNGKTGTNPPTSIDIALMCTKTQPLVVTTTTSRPGKGGGPPIITTTTTTTMPLASQALSVGGFAANANGLGATSEIISSTNTVSIGDTGQIGFNLPRPMLNELETAMKQRSYFSVFVIDAQSYNGNISAGNFNGNQTVTFHAAATNAALHPILDFTYRIDNSKIHTGGGITRTSKTGFMMEDVFAGTNSGFSS